MPCVERGGALRVIALVDLMIRSLSYNSFPLGVLKRIVSLVWVTTSVLVESHGLGGFVSGRRYNIVKSHYVRLTEPHNAFINFISNKQW